MHYGTFKKTKKQQHLFSAPSIHNTDCEAEIHPKRDLYTVTTKQCRKYFITWLSVQYVTLPETTQQDTVYIIKFQILKVSWDSFKLLLLSK